MILAIGIVIAALASLVFSTLTYSLRDFSRARLESYLHAHNRDRWLEPTIQLIPQLAFITAVGRLVANLAVVLGCVYALAGSGLPAWAHYLAAFLLAFAIGLATSVALPTALATHFGSLVIGLCVRPLHAMHWALAPLARLMQWTDLAVLGLTGGATEPEPEEIEKEILSVVEEGEKEGVVDTQEREMIESVIEFRDTEAGQIMTARPDIVALEVGATVEEAQRTIEESGHSRVPIYDGTLDHIVGILYARDLLKHLGTRGQQVELRSILRTPIFVPETKPLRDLLLDFRLQKIHIAIVLDEYGGTAGLVTIEDILEELVGEISDEHEPHEPAMLRRINETTFEVDARLRLDEVNREVGINLPEDAGYETLGGYVSSVLGQIPQKGTTFEQNAARFSVLDAEPQRVKRLRIELLPQPAEKASAR